MAEDREVALMWAEEQQLVCPTCATADWEWEEDENAYYPDLWTCHGCKRKAELRRQVTIDLDGQPPGAADGLQLRWFKTPRDPDAAT